MILHTRHTGDVYVLVGRERIFELFAGENVCGYQVAGCVVVGDGNLDDLARATFDHDVAVLAQTRALHGVGKVLLQRYYI